MIEIFNKNQDKLNSAIHQTVFRAELLGNGGLKLGRMGAVLLFHNYSRYISSTAFELSKMYHSFADHLFSNLIDKFDKINNVNLFNGMSGIGWGIIYLINNNMLSSEYKKLLPEIDEKVMRFDPRRYKDLSFETGLSGILFYINNRLKKSFYDHEPLPFDKIFFSDLESFCFKQKGENESLDEQFEIYQKLQNGNDNVQIASEQFLLKKTFESLLM